MKEKILLCGCHKIKINGNVYSRLDKGRKLIKKWRLLKNVLSKSTRYYQVSLHYKTENIHRLLAINFIQNSNNYPWVRHLNDIRTDNRIKNLAWGNKKMNGEDKVKNGHSIKGEKHPCSKLNEKKVKYILKNINNYSLNKLANKFNVSKKLILLIKQRKKWKHIK